jgi:hypothetical protein
MDIVIDQPSDIETRVTGVFASLLAHPLETVVFKWNWKSAVLSALLRAPIFFWAYLLQKHGVANAVGAMLAQAFFRALFGGVNGSIIQAFRKVQPAWHAVFTIPLVLAAFSHLIEFSVSAIYDAATGTHGKGKAILVSVIISVISAIFNLFAMRRGALLVKDESGQPFWRDLIRMPWIALEFISFPLIWSYKQTKRKGRGDSSTASAEPEDQGS